MLPKDVIVMEVFCVDDRPVVLVQTYCVEFAVTMRGDWKAKLWLEPTFHEKETGNCALE
jgi:hypothetical protein